MDMVMTYLLLPNVFKEHVVITLFTKNSHFI